MLSTQNVGHKVVAISLAILVYCAAFLIIAIQPAAALVLLPSTGGSPVLWHVTQALFQGLLLLGYLAAGYALGAKSHRRIVLYAATMLAGAAVVAFSRSDLTSVRPEETLSAAAAALILATSLGLAFALLSTCSLAGQYLYVLVTKTGQPFWLYAASNAGSLTAVFAYPILVEPNVDVRVQLLWWRWATVGALVAIGVTAAVLSRYAKRDSRETKATPRFALPKVGQGSRWFIGGSVPVGLSLACTTYLATDLGSHPVVWLGPFGAYLLTLILAFSQSGSRTLVRIGQLAPFAVAFLIAGLLRPWPSNGIGFGAYLTATGILLARWHIWLAAQKPDTTHLTPFYGLATLGGLCSSALLGLAVPIVLDPGTFGNPNSVFQRLLFGPLVPEYLLFVIASAVLIVRSDWKGLPSLRNAGKPIAEGLVLGFVVVTVARPAIAALSASTPAYLAAVGGITGLASVAFLVRGSLQCLVGIITVSVVAVLHSSFAPNVVEQRRSLFGHVLVRDLGDSRVLQHGTTIHGSQPLVCALDSTADRCAHPVGYYDLRGPIGRVVTTIKAPLGRIDLGIIGLGAGTMAAYCKDSDTVSFFEIDPVMYSIALSRFRYLEGSRRQCVTVDVKLGDARLLLRKEHDERFHVLVNDAFSSDSIPVHLLTKDAMVEFKRVVHDDGVIAYHTSNRYFELEPVVLATARAAGLSGLAVKDLGGGAQNGEARPASTWVFLSAQEATLARLRDSLLTRGEKSTSELRPHGRATIWTDQRHSLFTVLRRSATRAVVRTGEAFPTSSGRPTDGVR